MDFGGRISKVCGSGKKDRKKERKEREGERETRSVILLTQRKVEINEGFMARGQREAITGLKEKNAPVKRAQKEGEQKERQDTMICACIESDNDSVLKEGAG